MNPPSATVERRIRNWMHLSWWPVLIVGTVALLYLRSAGTGGFDEVQVIALACFAVGAVQDRLVSHFYRRDSALGLFTRQGFAAGLPWYAAAVVLFLATALQVDHATLSVQIVAR